MKPRAERRSRSDEALAERALQLGKIQNLRIACRALDGLFIPAGAVFSFWRQVGPPLAIRGYVPGRMLREGCMVAAVGGGLCQLSNALYDVALQAGCRIVERHSHSRVVPGSAAARDRDATVAWNYVDLRFSPDRDLRLTARLDQDDLVVRLLGESHTVNLSDPDAQGPSAETPAFSARSCATCDETGCHLHEAGQRTRPTRASARAFLVDEAWPEFRAHVAAARGPGVRRGRPRDGARLGLSRYDWSLDGFEHPASAPLAAFARTLALRAAGSSGPAARRAELLSAEPLARALARLLTPEVTAVTLAQSYLPFLWRDGHLGGREVSVMMSRPPMSVLQARLDDAAAAHPERVSLSDFRAPPWLAEAEDEALAGCAHIVTPHAEIAALFGDRSVRLPWVNPPARPLAARGGGGRIAFPGPTVGRKGAWAVREAAIALDLEVAPLGAELEGADFWRGVRLAPDRDWIACDVVVQPALVETHPRRQLAALAAGLPVIASPAWRPRPTTPGLVLAPPDDPDALIAALRRVLAERPAALDHAVRNSNITPI